MRDAVIVSTARTPIGKMGKPEDVAEAVVKTLAREEFLILPHPTVSKYMGRKASDYDRWLRGMRRLRSRLYGEDV